jgi:hypothetical protein
MWIPNTDAAMMLPPPPRDCDLRGADEKQRWIRMLKTRLEKKRKERMTPPALPLLVSQRQESLRAVVDSAYMQLLTYGSVWTVNQDGNPKLITEDDLYDGNH